MTKHPLDIIADKWKSTEEQYFSDQTPSLDFFELNLKGNPKTGSQIKDWLSPKIIAMKNDLDTWDWSKPYNPDLTGESEVKQFDRLLSLDENPDTLPEIGYFELYKSSKLTDFVSGSFMQQYGLIVSNIAKDILETHNLGQVKFYNLSLEHKGQFYNNYFFLKTLSSAVDYIDFEKSLFYQQEGLLELETRKDIEINSLQDVENHKQKYSGMDTYFFAKKIVLKDNFPNFDYFTFYNYGLNKRFISAKLAIDLEKSTGLEILQTNRIYR
jgi:hypothetical protein